MMERRVTLLREGESQVVLIPPEFELPGDEAILRKENGHLVLEPAEPETSLVEYLRNRGPIDEEWPDIADPPPEPVNL